VVELQGCGLAFLGRCRSGDEQENERREEQAAADRGTPLGHACLLSKDEWYARKRDQGTISCERELAWRNVKEKVVLLLAISK
jgi:hypothetical protein